MCPLVWVRMIASLCNFMAGGWCGTKFCEDAISLPSQLEKLFSSNRVWQKKEREDFFSPKCVVEKNLFFFFLSTAINWLLQTHLTSCRDDWQAIVHVIANQVTDVLEAVVFGAHLWQQKTMLKNYVLIWTKYWKHFIILLTTPSGSTRSRCLGWLPCCPVRTYWPGVVPDSRTRKSPSLVRSLSACLRLRGPWNQGSFCSCSAIGAATAPDTTKAASNGSKR